jgi:hypothetical protein
VQRYYTAFENESLPETRFIGRVDALERRLSELRAKLEDLRDAASNLKVPSEGAVRDAEDALRDAMLNGTPGQRKALLKELVVEVRGREQRQHHPDLPLRATSVRVTESMVGRGGLEPPTSAVIDPER